MLWSLVWVGVAFGYHIDEPAGVLSITINGHTYTGNPPALTLVERDPFSIYLGLAIVGAAILTAVIEATALTRRQSDARAVASAVGGGLLVAYSLLGLLWGLLSIGVVGGLLALSSRPPRRAVATTPGNVTTSPPQ